MKRSYRQNCALAHALDLVGERWSLLVIRELMVGPKRYGELLQNLRGIGTNLLAERLKDLETNGLLLRDDGRYSLSDAGRGLEPVVWELVRFGLSLGIDDADDRLTRSEWDAVALTALYDDATDPGIDGRFVIRLNDAPFRIDKTDSRLTVSPGDAEDAVASVALSKTAARALASGETSFADADIAVTGSRREAKKLLQAFGIVP